MTFTELPVVGAFLVELEPRTDDRGFFARSWCARELSARGLVADLRQCNISCNTRRGTVRGMHFSAHVPGEAKVVRCTAGKIFDVLLDLRPDSRSYRKWAGIELGAADRRMVYVPPGVAHGFQTLADGAEVFYQMSEFYAPELSRGVRWDDPAFDIRWPEPVTLISAQDRGYPDHQSSPTRK